MNSVVRAKALKSAAKVAFSAAFLGGCAAETLENVESSTESDLSTLEPCGSEDAGTVKTDSGAKAAKDSGAVVDSGVLTCDVQLKALVSSGDAGVWWDMPSNHDPVLAACCEQKKDETFDAGGFAEFAARENGCCLVAGWDRGTACTPWGPPVPPKMKARRSTSVNNRVARDERRAHVKRYAA